MKSLIKKLLQKDCKCSQIPMSDYPTKNEGKLIKMLNGEWLAKSSMPYMAPELWDFYMRCEHKKA